MRKPKEIAAGLARAVKDEAIAHKLYEPRTDSASTPLPPPPSAGGPPRPDSDVRWGANKTCPNCGGSQWRAKHSLGRKLAFGVGALLASPNEVECIICGWTYKR
jgi:hypothetical protein